MPRSTRVQAEADGVLFRIVTDVDSGEEIERVELPLEDQSLKVRLGRLAAQNVDEWRAWQWRIDHIADYGLAPGPQATLLAALVTRRDEAAARDLAILQRWRTA